ncbi:TPA: hypothetical protein UL242_002521 [Clostridioides difficile]|uniref:hypothetical protein n=1 Tax=Clostridioides difficile TaxID=1496 RepID=UPI001A1A5150|nr:hypothetical protein [Clostridioides difficile]EGT3642179.1 hypothetical protein [Clostridioides difficile]MBH7168547.1 hypothetical protein [Clostridioides difficile]MBH7847311.1 hypothetical protein [Clostridioides difficile]MBY1346130.1 hypothetical protein [Clostridioides difficile]MBY1660895.1 hypothetical protein [Clostridioides difficile]
MEEEDRIKKRKDIKDSIIGFVVKVFIIGIGFMYMNDHMETGILNFSLPYGKELFSINAFLILKFLFNLTLIIEGFTIIVSMMNYYIENL